MIRIRCSDIDLEEYELQVQGYSGAEIVEMSSLNLRNTHRIVNISKETMEKIWRAVSAINFHGITGIRTFRT